jgi:hypothetical protein
MLDKSNAGTAAVTKDIWAQVSAHFGAEDLGPLAIKGKGMIPDLAFASGTARTTNVRFCHLTYIDLADQDVCFSSANRTSLMRSLMSANDSRRILSSPRLEQLTP